MFQQAVSRARGIAVTVGVLVCSSLALAACGGSDSGSGSSSSASSASGDANKHVNIAHFVAIQANPLEQIVISQSKKVAAANNASVTIFDSNNDVQKEINNCNDAIASQKYDAFVLKAVSGPPLMACARKAIAAGIPVVAQGTALGPVQTADPQVKGLTGSVVTLSTTVGTSLAGLASDACDKAVGSGKPCKAIYLFGPVAFDYAAIVRKTLLADFKANHPNIDVQAQQTVNFDPDQASTAAKQLLQAHPDTNVVVSDCDSCSVAITKVIKGIGKEGKILIASSGGQGIAIDAIKAGTIFGTAVILPKSESGTAVKMAIDAARKQKIANPNVDVTKQLSKVGPIVTKQNADKFVAQF
jgi:ribose transport system substrate-binding protein